MKFDWEKTGRQIENEITQKIYSISALIDVIDFDRIFYEIKDNSILGKEFDRINNCILAGQETISALRESEKKLSNRYYSELISFLINIYETGAQGSEILLKLADKITTEQLLEKEKQASLVMQKYTVISAVFIIPLLLGSVLFVVSGMNFSFLEKTQEISLEANIIYLFLNSVILGVFMGNLENSNFKILSYSVVFALLSISLFLLSYQGFFANIIK